MSTAAAGHWDGVYASRAVTDVSWYQANPSYSLELIADAGTLLDEPVIDIGGGGGVLVDHLLGRGYTDVTVLDIAAGALAASQNRLGREATAHWITADVLAWRPARRYQLWHDRAVFHFLAEAADRDRYRAVLHHALARGGHIVLGTFAGDGPARCSGLPTARYTPEDLAAEFSDYRVLRSTREEHRTPAGSVQPFTWLHLSTWGTGASS